MKISYFYAVVHDYKINYTTHTTNNMINEYGSYLTALLMEYHAQEAK